ncbi:transporter substrate-binding domain-containing protein [Pseudomonas sp. dw_358]|uniref:substrate-binding periplasmic protein n=1 Tax=Pseudomonas sp. dw_358 TaxID=2720083 RepID=UPI001BD35F68|nr:transporter substrate-binding domain-containing protein [Pseudomonas sp. dw_358]
MRPSTLTSAFLCLWLGLLCGPAAAEQYQVVTEEWAPYNYEENHQLTGITTDIVRAIMALTGDHFDMLLMPSMRTTRALDTRPKTIMYSMFRTPQREPLYKWVGPIVEESIYPYQLGHGQPSVNTLEQLRQAAQITTRQDGLIPQVLQAQGFTNLDKSASSNLQLYRMLLARRTDIIVGDTATGVAYYSRQLQVPPGTLRRIPVELYRSSLYIAFSRDSDDKVVAAWSRALEQLRQSGQLARIQHQYDPVLSP